MESLMKEFNSLQSQIVCAYHDAAVKLGVSDTELDILYVMNTQDGECNQSALYKLTGITKSTINSALHKMEKRGLVALKAGAGRNVAVTLTDEGRRFSDSTLSRIISIENEIYSGWTAEERAMLVELNRKFLTEFKEKTKTL